jgi:hypothetical protein
LEEAAQKCAVTRLHISAPAPDNFHIWRRLKFESKKPSGHTVCTRSVNPYIENMPSKP